MTVQTTTTLAHAHAAPASGPRARRDLLRRLKRLPQPVFVLVLVALVLGLPLYMVILTAGKSTTEAATPNLSLPTHWQFAANFSDAISDGRVLSGLVGTLVLTIPTVLIVLVLGSMASWVLARRASRLTAVLYALAISGIILPPAIVTVVLLVRQLGLSGTAVGMIGVYCGIYMSTVIFFVTGFIRGLPVELEEAARIDGAGPLSVFFRIILPLLGPVLATASILICLYVWTDVFTAFFVVGGRMDTLTLNLFSIASSGQHELNFNLIFAYIILMSLPLLIVFIVAQRQIISGVTAGAVK